MEILDFHAHILPCMDHGSQGASEGKKQLAMMQAAGVQTVCATSHFYPQKILPSAYLEKRDAGLKMLLHACGDSPRPCIIPGAEVLICAGMEEMEELECLCMEGTNVLLLEMPFIGTAWNQSLYDTVRRIAQRGIYPVIAHVDRYPSHLVKRFFDMNITGQINALPLTRLLMSRDLLRMMEEGSIAALGSDLHGSDPKGYAPFTKLPRFYPRICEKVMAKTATLLRNAKRY